MMKRKPTKIKTGKHIDKVVKQKPVRVTGSGASEPIFRPFSSDNEEFDDGSMFHPYRGEDD
jgi:hypothetical protein